MALGRLWAGNVYGTSTGNVFLKLEGPDTALRGTLRHNEPGVPIVLYNVSGSFDGTHLAFDGEPQTKIEGAELGKVKATARLEPNGMLRGEWETSNGSGGIFSLHPHDHSNASAPSGLDQFHTAPHNFGPIEIDRDQIISLGDAIQASFTSARVVVTFGTGTQQSRWLEDFKQLSLPPGRVAMVRLSAREPDVRGMEKSITVEFGQTTNFATVQGASEAWALGEMEKLKRHVARFERVYAVHGLGVTVNQFMLLGALVFLPSLGSFGDRLLLIGGVLVLMYCVTWLHNRYLPLSSIYLGKRKEGFVARYGTSAFSWFIGIVASVIAALLGAYLKGVLSLTP